MKKYWVYFKGDLQRVFEYRADNIIYSLSNITTPLISLGLWLAISNSGANLSYSKPEVIIYFIVAIFVKSVVFTWADYYLESSILKGTFSNSLVKPFSVVDEFTVHNIAEKLFRVSFILIIITILSLTLLPMSYFSSVNIIQIILFLASLFIASVLNFLIDVIIGLSTFWFHEVEFARGTSDFINLIFSGKVIPLIFMPAAVLNLAIYLPFRYTFSLPIEILMDRVIGPGLIFAFITQGIWLLLVFALYKFIYARGIKLYQGYGT